ncbi:hypothetical protein [Acrocarpospora sp. B8E8]|uniref:hypothetical protein n=1 Tax=Acrocarpospora sp. B8E8 TaxID=3153572 RepID=UPI00325E369C
MGEPAGPGLVGRGEDARPARLGGQLDDPGRAGPGHVGEDVGQDDAAGDGRGLQQLRALAGQAGQAAADDVPDRCRNLGGGAAGGEQAAQLPGVEGVPAAAAVHQLGPPVRHRRPGDGLDQVGDLAR